jgi:hypothetical protein
MLNTTLFDLFIPRLFDFCDNSTPCHLFETSGLQLKLSAGFHKKMLHLMRHVHIAETSLLVDSIFFDAFAELDH